MQKLKDEQKKTMQMQIKKCRGIILLSTKAELLVTTSSGTSLRGTVMNIHGLNNMAPLLRRQKL